MPGNPLAQLFGKVAVAQRRAVDLFLLFQMDIRVTLLTQLVYLQKFI